MKESWMVLLIVLALMLLGAFWRIWILKRRNKKLLKVIGKSVQAEEAAKLQKEIQEAMLPAQLLALFRNGNMEDVRLGEEQNLKAAVLSFNLPGFSEMIRSWTSEQIFGFVNQVLSYVVPSVLYQEGEIDKFSKAGLTAFYMNAPERALRSAVSICEAMNGWENGQTEYSIGISYGDVMAGIVGHEKRFGVLTISETTGFAEFLQKLAGSYGARILISGSMKRQIPNFEKRYNSRYLGCIYLKAADAAEDLYEIFDGDDPADRNGKRRTRLLFEKGVELFQNHRFYDARMHFIEVLKANRMDGMARKYLYLCNQYQSKKGTEDSGVYFGVY